MDRVLTDSIEIIKGKEVNFNYVILLSLTSIISDSLVTQINYT